MYVCACVPSECLLAHSFACVCACLPSECLLAHSFACVGACQVLHTFEGVAGVESVEALRQFHSGFFEQLLPTARLHEPEPDRLPAAASAHVAVVLGVFAMDMTPALFARLEMDREFFSVRTLAVVTPVLGRALESELAERRAAAAARGGGAPVYPVAGWALRGLQVAKGLAHAHARRVVHRNVAADNVLLGDGLRLGGDGVPDDEAELLCVVADFGESLDLFLHGDAGYMTAATHPRGGAPAYWSPEVSAAAVRVRGATIDYDKQDAWGLGCLLWTMLSCDGDARPFNVPSPAVATDAAFTLPSDAAGGVGGARRGEQRAALDIVRGLLRVAPRDRWSLDDAVAALEVLLFVVPMMDEEALAGAGGGGGGVAEDAVFAALADVSLRAAVAAASEPHVRVRDALAADFLCSDRAAPAAVARTLRMMLA